MATKTGSAHLRGHHVVMLVNNPCVNDSRVIKSAEALVRTGWRVTVLCRQAEGLPMCEEKGGVYYQRVAPIPLDWQRLKRRLGSWLSIEPEKAALPGGQSGLALIPELAPRANDSESAALTPLVDSGAPSQPRSLIAWPESGVGAPDSRARPLVWRAVRKVRGQVVRSARRFLMLWSKKLLRTVYFFAEADEFGSAAQPLLRELAPDIIHAHDLNTLPLGGRVAKAVGARLVYDSHELEMHRNAVYPRLVKWRRRWLETKYIRQADSVITVSESIADHLRDDYSIARPHVIMNAPVFDDAVTAERDLRSDLGLSEDTPLAVYVGSVTINRGIEQTVRALAHAPDLHFALVGPRRPAVEEAAVKLADELAVRDRLHFVDPLAPAEVVGYIRTAGVSILPIQNICLSYYYCMPNKLLESVFAGVPVAVANLLELRRFVEAHRCGLVMNETDPQDIARVLLRVLADRRALVLSVEDRERLARHYGWPSQAERLRNLYDGLMQDGDTAAVVARGA